MTNRTFLIPEAVANGTLRVRTLGVPYPADTAGVGMLEILPHEGGNATDNISDVIDLAAMIGPKRVELYKAIPITITYCVIFIMGIVGNISTCVVIAKNRYMQTATNYYLFNLAISDLLLLILGLPQETYVIWSAYPWIFGEPFCILRIMVSEASTYASILTITAFTMERYLAICHSMRARRMSSLKRATAVIIIIWIVSGVCSIPMVVQFGMSYVDDGHGGIVPESAQCNIIRYLKHAFEVATFLFFLTPMTVITVLYVLIGLAIRRSTLSRAGSDSSNHSGHTGTDLRAQQQARARRAVLKMLVAVVVAFFICWAPFHAQRLMVMYMDRDAWTAAAIQVREVLFYVSGVLYYVSSVINPILYNIMSLKFRQAFRNTICRPCKRRRKKTTITACTYKTYRFNQRPLLTDTNLTLLQLHLNGYKNKNGDLRKYRQHLTPGPVKYAPGRSNSSSVSGCSSPRMLNQEIQDPFDDIELEQVLADFKSCQSCHSSVMHRNNSTVNHNFRPYHSYA